MDINSSTKAHSINVASSAGEINNNERMIKADVKMDDPFCCLCDIQTMKTSSHLFAEYAWVTIDRKELLLCTNTHIQVGDIKHVLMSIRRKYQKKWWPLQVVQFYTTLGGLKIGRSSNRVTQGTNVVIQVKEKIVHRIELVNKSKRAYRSREFTHWILCI